MKFSEILSDIASAKKILPTIWPIKSFIAMNPLWDMVPQPLHEAAKNMSRFVNIDITLDISDYKDYYNNRIFSHSDIINAAKELTDWSNEEINAFSQNIMNDITIKHLMVLEEKLSKIKNKPVLLIDQLSTHHEPFLRDEMMNDLFTFYARYFAKEQHQGLFEAWCIENKHNNQDSLSYIANRCSELGLMPEYRVNYFKHILSRTIGYAGFVKWLEQRPNNPLFQSNAHTEDMIAIWLKKEESIVKNYPQFRFQSDMISEPAALYNPIDQSIQLGMRKSLQPSLAMIKYILQHAFERHYINTISQQLHYHQRSILNHTPSAQFIFCIDSRSEGIRRHIEACGEFETFGFAGFYGLPLESKSASHSTKLLCPAICEPSIPIEIYQRNSHLANTMHNVNNLINNAKHNSAAALNLYDMVGMWSAPITALKNLYPGFFQKMIAKLKQPQEHIRLPANDKVDMTLIIGQIANVLKSIGLTTNFARYVFVCGHEAKTQNNPFHASFECGACGGNSGFNNAKVFTAYINRKEVRAGLKNSGIHIPDNTQFISACHKTTTDELVFDTDIQTSPCRYLQTIQNAIHVAEGNLRNEKSGDTAFSLYHDNDSSWSELIPEAGLLNNATMIIAPRSVTQSLNLKRRAFLHSYNHTDDQDGKILESIMTAPVIVAHWINMQYFFSSTSPTVYGAGNKALHNLIGDIGVLEGNGGDLKIGLPLQSVTYRSKLLHEPRRLAVFIYAPKSRIDAIIANNTTLQHLINGQWLHLEVIEPKEHS